LIENDKYDWITIHVRQYGEIILSGISTWKFGKEGMENVLTEIQIYDLKGNLFYSVIEDGVMPTSTVTLNKKYLLTCSGGQFTENEKDFLPFTANIYDIEKGETVWKDKSTEYQINIEADRHSNWVRLTYVKNYDRKDPSNLFYLLDLENYIFWKFKSLDKCVSGEVRMYLEPKQFIFYNTKLGDNIIENELKLEIDFKRIEELPHDK
jgi:hypothetical protein